MSIPLKEISELEQLEAQANEQIAEAQRLRATTVPKLEQARREQAHARDRAASCKQLVANWEKMERDWAALEDRALEALATGESATRTAQGTIAVVRAAMNHEFPGALPDQQ